MKLRVLLTLAMAYLSLGLYAQQTAKTAPEGVVRCYTTESEEVRRANNPGIGTMEDFERWLAPLVAQYEEDAGAQRAVTTIPIVFHIIHNNGADNVSATYINAQIEQLNMDFRKTGSGSNSHPDGADSEIEFCAAVVDPNGNTMAEPGIDRINRSSAGFSAPPYSQSYYQSTLKPNTIWDPTQYCNVWVSDLSGGLLGYAQFPEAASLGGIGTGNGGASTDGVVVIYSSVGSQATPFPGGGNYDGGRTLTHELGHWLGLRYFWGDGGCGVDDYCNDTPKSDAANYGCPTTHASCGTTDMVQNYMDYTNDYCMNIFTDDQKARMQTVMSSSIRRASLASSSACNGGGGGGDTQAPSTPANLTASNIATTTVTLSWSASSDNVGVTGYDVYVNGNLLGNTANTSANITGLTPFTTYTAAVRAKDAAGNQSGAANTTFTTLSDGSTCVDSDITVTINLDNYPEETTWAITSGGSTVASGGTYGSQPDGSTVTINETLADGSYTFTINDSYGDGICCGYGSGSYIVSSGSTVIASGGSFGSTESTNFCVEGSGGGGDTEAPSQPGNVSASNITTSSATISWNASTDNVGVTGYNVYVDGHLVTTITGTAQNLSGLDPSTSYTVSVTAIDAAGNESSAGSVTLTTTAAPDTTPPTAPSNVTASNIAETTADISWTASQDLVGVVSYNVYMGGSLAGNVTGTSTSLSGLTANTTYTVSITALDAAGNESASGSTSFTTLSGGGGPSSEEIFGHYFESGWDGWVDGGSDCYRYNGSRSYEGSRSIRLRDNSGTKSAMTLNNVDVTGYDLLELTFYFYPRSMETNEDFWVRINDGSGWQTVASYARGTDFNNNAFYTATVTMSSSSFNFNSGFDLRFQCDASGNADQIYIDQVTLTGFNNGRSLVSGVSQSIALVDGNPAPEVEVEGEELIDLFDGDLMVYPNPATNFIHVVSGLDADFIRIYSITGTLVSEMKTSNEQDYIMDVSRLEAGTYIVQLQGNGEVAVEKFIKY